MHETENAVFGLRSPLMIYVAKRARTPPTHLYIAALKGEWVLAARLSGAEDDVREWCGKIAWPPR